MCTKGFGLWALALGAGPPRFRIVKYHQANPRRPTSKPRSPTVPAVSRSEMEAPGAKRLDRNPEKVSNRATVRSTRIFRLRIVRRSAQMRRTFLAAVLAVSTAAAVTGKPEAQSPARANWLMDGGDPQRTSWQKQETLLSPASVKNMKLLWT